MSEETVAVVRGIYDAFAAGDVGTVLGVFAPDIEWHEAEGMPYGGVYHDPNAVAENVFAPLAEDVEGFSVTPEQYVDAGDVVVALGNYSGRGKESGTEFTIPFAHAWTIGDGVAVRFHQYVDTAKFNEALTGQPA